MRMNLGRGHSGALHRRSGPFIGINNRPEPSEPSEPSTEVRAMMALCHELFSCRSPSRGSFGHHPSSLHWVQDCHKSMVHEGIYPEPPLNRRAGHSIAGCRGPSRGRWDRSGVGRTVGLARSIARQSDLRTASPRPSDLDQSRSTSQVRYLPLLYRRALGTWVRNLWRIARDGNAKNQTAGGSHDLDGQTKSSEG